MKRVHFFLLAIALCLGSAAIAKADGVDVKVKGQWDFVFGHTDKDFRKSAQSGRWVDTSRGIVSDDYRPRGDRSIARQRVRTQIDFIASEYLSAVLMFEIGDLRWGDTNSGSKAGQGSGADLDADGVNIETKRAYLDWVIPYTEISVRMGLQGLYLPATALGNPVFTADVAAITVSAPVTDWLSAMAFWARPYDQYYNDGNEHVLGLTDFDDEMDMFGLLLPMNFESIALSFTPWFIYADIGNASFFYLHYMNRYNAVPPANGSAKAWWLGGNLGFTLFEPLEFGLDVMYGHLGPTNALSGAWGSSHVMGSGWYIGATLDYKLDFVTPGIFGWYATGDSKAGANDYNLGRIPTIAQEDGFTATSFGAKGYYGIGNGNDTPAVTSTGIGTWGLGIQLADMSFLEDLKHTLRFAYYRGTNDSDIIKDGVNGYWQGGMGSGGFLFNGYDLYLTDDDSVFEINFDHQYKIYENLTMVLELGYIRLMADADTWGVSDSKLKNNDNAWKAELNFRYSF